MSTAWSAVRAGRAWRATRWSAILGLIGAAWVPAARAQAAWTARLAINSYPSPYLSDWQSNPTIGTLTITNPTGADRSVLLAFRVTDQGGRLLASGRSDPQLVTAGMPAVISDFVNLNGTSQHDATLEDQMRRTGRLPEGENTACVDVTDAGGFVLAEDCASFSIIYPDPPSLIGPLDETVLTTGNPIFQWTPLQVPPAFLLTYVVRVTEVLDGQAPLQALTANIPVLETTTSATSLEYPISALPLVEGKSYAWRVQALDQNGYPASANDGRSDVATFTYDAGQGGAPGARAMTFTLFNAYDHVSTPDAGAAVTPPPTTYKFNDICDQWTAPPPDGLTLDVNVPFGFHGFRADEAALYRVTDAGNRSAPHQWWVYARLSAGPGVLLHGDCSSRVLGGFQWAAVSTPGVQQSLSDFIGGASGSGPIESIDYGLWIVALHGGTVSVPAEFAEGAAFLGEHEVEVRRGLNGYAVLNLRDNPLSDVFDALGYDEPQVVLQGFVGLDVARSVGAGLGDNWEAAISQQRSFLLLSAALPKREPFGPLSRIADSMGLSFEFEIQDSTGVNITANDTHQATSQTKYSRDYIFRVKHTIYLRPELFRSQDTLALVGWVGADIASQREQQTRDVAQRSMQKLNRAGQWLSRGRTGTGGRVGTFFGVTDVCQPRPALKTHVDLVVNYGLSGDIHLGPVVFTDPAVEMHIGPKADNGQRDISVAIVTKFGLDGYEQGGILGISRVREYPDAEADPACQPARPRSTTIVDEPTSRPRSDANADTQGRGTLDTPDTRPAGPLSTPWKWNWKLAWDIAPVGLVGKITNGALGVVFALLGLGGV